MCIYHVNQIVKEPPNIFLSPTEFESKYQTKVCPLTFYGKTPTLRELWKNQKPPSVLFKIEKVQQTNLSKTGGIKM